MRERIWSAIGFWAMGLILFLATMIIIRWAVGFASWASLSAADTGTWAGAIGTVATLIWTVRLATAERRRLNRESHVVALLAAGRFMPQVAMLNSEVNRAIGYLKSQLAVDQGDVMFKLALETLSHPLDLHLNEIATLAPLPNNCAINLANGLGFLHAAKILLEKATANRRLLVSTELAYRKNGATGVLRNLEAAKELLHSAGMEMDRSCRIAAEVTDDPPVAVSLDE